MMSRGQSTGNREESMDVITIVLIGFCLLELSNVVMLYFVPGSRRGNGIGMFNAYEKSRSDPEVFALITYLIHWVAGTKLIFIALLIGIMITGDPAVKVFSISALIFSIMTFYIRMYPGMKKMDEAGQITPKGYSRILARMIAGIVVVFAAALAVSMVL